MSDTRREIAERHAQEWLARWGSAPPNAAIESAMSDYAAALLEDVANKAVITQQDRESGAYHLVVRTDVLRARAAQERER